MGVQDFDVVSTARTDTPEFKSALLRIVGELHRRVGIAGPSSVDFFVGALRSLAAVKGARQLEPRMNALHDCGVFFYWNDREVDALRAARLLQDLAKRSPSEDWSRKAYQLEGTILSESGRVAEAVIAYSKALEHARTLPSSTQAKTLINLGVALNYGALYRDAIPCFELAYKNLEASGSHNFEAGAALANIAQSNLLLGNYEPGYELALRALKITSAASDSYTATGLTIREYIAFRLALELERIDDARGHMERCVAHSKASSTARSRFVSEIATGLYDVYSASNVQDGLETLQEALARSNRIGSYYEEALSALVRAYDRAGEAELALHSMKSLMSHLRSIRSELSSASAVSSLQEVDLLRLELDQSKLQTKVALNVAYKSQLEMFERLAVTADLKEEASGEHGYRVGRLSAIMAEELGWSREACRAIDIAARLHDIGKIAMPDRILLTSEQLREAERHIMSTHTLVGAELLAKSNIPQLQMAEEIAKFHHEWWNGEGYPSKRRGKRIPIHARIVALADVFDALTHGRPFAEPWPMDRALEEIRTRRGTHFDPELTDLFIDLVGRLRREHDNLDDYLGKAGRNSPFLQARQRIRVLLDQPSEAITRRSKEQSDLIH
jgi:putative two-component system response regulator